MAAGLGSGQISFFVIRSGRSRKTLVRQGNPSISSCGKNIISSQREPDLGCGVRPREFNGRKGDATMDYHNQAFELVEAATGDASRHTALVKRIGDALSSAANPVWGSMFSAPQNRPILVLLKGAEIPEVMAWRTGSPLVAGWYPVTGSRRKMSGTEEDEAIWTDLPKAPRR